MKADVERFEELAELEPMGRRYRRPWQRRRRVAGDQADRTDLATATARRRRRPRRHCRGDRPEVVAAEALVSLDGNRRVAHNQAQAVCREAIRKGGTL